MYITRDMDSFDVLHLREDATNEEIKKAFISHIDIYCGEDGSGKDRDGEYLFNIYREHYKRLMDPEERQKLIEQRKLRSKNSSLGENTDNDTLLGPYENALIVPTTLEEKQKYIITSINQEIVQRFQENSAMKSGRIFSLKRVSQKLKKVPLKDVYVVVGKDCSLLFTESCYASSYCNLYDSKKREFEKQKGDCYKLIDCFTGQNIFGTNAVSIWNQVPWTSDGIFEVHGVPSTSFLASKIFPHSLVHHGEITDYDFRMTYDIISKYLHANSDHIASLFDSAREEENEENSKKNSKKKRYTT